MLERYAIAEQLGEDSPQAVALIGRILRTLGPDATRHFVAEAQRLDASGGLLTEDGSRKRTLGGTFFYLIKEHLRSEGTAEVLQQLFPRRTRRPVPVVPPSTPLAAAEPPRMVGDVPPPPPMPTRLRPRPRPRSTLSHAVDPIFAPAPSRPPTQAEVMRVIERHLGVALDVYRRSYNPDTGAVTLYAHFPERARQRYAEAMRNAEQQAGVAITIADQVHYGMLMSAVRSAVPEGVPVTQVLLHAAERRAIAHGPELLDPQQLEAAQQQFEQTTGWQLQFELEHEPITPERYRSSDAALSFAWLQLPIESGCYAIGAHQDEQTLVVRLAFPDIAARRYAANLARIERVTGWKVQVHPAPQQERLAAIARALLPGGMQPVGAASVQFDTHRLSLTYAGSAAADEIAQAQERFAAETGWMLDLVPAR